MLNRAEVWADVMKIGKHRRRMNVVTQKRIPSAYRTVLKSATFVVTDVITIDFLVWENKIIYDRKIDIEKSKINKEDRPYTRQK